MLPIHFIQVSHEKRIFFTSFASIRVDSADMRFQSVYDKAITRRGISMEGGRCWASHVVSDQSLVLDQIYSRNTGGKVLGISSSRWLEVMYSRQLFISSNTENYKSSRHDPLSSSSLPPHLSPTLLVSSAA